MSQVPAGGPLVEAVAVAVGTSAVAAGRVLEAATFGAAVTTVLGGAGVAEDPGEADDTATIRGMAVGAVLPAPAPLHAPESTTPSTSIS